MPTNVQSNAHDSNARSPLRASDVVFMYAADSEHYRAYGATFTAWGRAEQAAEVERHHQLGLRCTGTIWCLTAGEVRLHESAEMREAVARDITGKPVRVPWLMDHVYEGTPAWFGCTNHPAFRRLNRELARRVMAGGADGLHIDDPRGTSGALEVSGGGFCDHCMAAFREWLQKHGERDELVAAGVNDLEAFDYRGLVRRYANTREEFLDRRQDIPLYEAFVRFHREAAAENIRGIIREAEQEAGRQISASVNAVAAHESFHEILALDEVTHVVCEVPQYAEAGTKCLCKSEAAYDQAAELGKPMAATASGHDWAWVKAHDATDLPKVWIALAYACGQRFMVPHPTRQWCMTEFLGTHWYAAAVEPYIGIYRFIADHAELFDGYESGPPVPQGQTPANTMVRTRVKDGAPPVVHVVNTDYAAYDPKQKHRNVLRPQQQIEVSLPATLDISEAGNSCDARDHATLLRYDADPITVPVERRGDQYVITLPELNVWTAGVLGDG